MNRIAVKVGILILGVFAGGPLSARQTLDLSRIEQEAEAIRCLADDLRPELRDHFHCSGIIRDLNRARNDVESAARRVRSATRSRNRVCDLPGEVTCLFQSISQLQCFIERARGYRQDFGPTGLDIYCASRVEQILSEMCRRATLIEAMVGTGPVFGFQDNSWSAVNTPRILPSIAPAPIPVPLAAQRRVQFVKEVERSRSVTRSRDFRSR